MAQEASGLLQTVSWADGATAGRLLATPGLLPAVSKHVIAGAARCAAGGGGGGSSGHSMHGSAADLLLDHSVSVLW